MFIQRSYITPSIDISNKLIVSKFGSTVKCGHDTMRIKDEQFDV